MNPMATYQQFQVEAVQRFLNGHGFNITNQHHRPLFSVVYQTEAEAGRAAIAAALAKATEVTNYGDFP
jgi:hypothetical protein